MRKNLNIKYIITNTTTYLIKNFLSFNNPLSFNVVGNEDWHNYNNILNLANMSHVVYYDNYEWGHNISSDKDGVKAYVFSNQDETVNVVAFKGTTVDIIHSLESVGGMDKKNDNLFFSCCYYKQVRNLECPSQEQSSNGIFGGKQICDIEDSYRNCSMECYKDSLNYEYNYYNIGKNIIDAWKSSINFENSLVIFSGHSLGGALATMMGITYNKYVVTFESPGEKHYIDLAGLKYTDENIKNIYHYGHNADIIFTGKCKGGLSLCKLGGYTIETKCHIGNVCEYDVINKLNIRESIFTHKIKYVIDNVITQWNDTLPSCEIKKECQECLKWNYS